METLIGVHLWFDVPAIVSYIIYIATSIFLSWLCTLAFPKLESMHLSTVNIKIVESADYTFIPMYLAYVFIGISVHGDMSFILCYLLISVLCFCSQSYYFNPLFYVLGYRYYFVTNSLNKKVLVITKKHIYLGQNVDFPNLKRLNDYTYVDLNR